MMTNMNQPDVYADVAKAIERQDYEGGRETVRDILQATAPNSCQYWSEAACELHRHEKFYEALDCWKEAEKHFAASNDLDDYWCQDYIRTLINATDQTGDRYFTEQALYACERITEKIPSEDLLNYKLELLQIVKPSKEAVLDLIEQMLDRGYEVRRKIYVNKLGLECPYPMDEIESYSDLAELYLWNNKVSEALRIWAKAVTADKSVAREKIASAIFMLVWYADKNGFDEAAYLPEEFGRID
jgi:hypothetical protein